MAPATSSGNVLAGRFYHSNALLLRDGRVFSSAGEAENDPSLPYPNYMMFSPPYLFQGPAPIITSAPEHAAYGSTIAVITPMPSDIKSVALIKLAAVTHGTNMDQRYIPLNFTIQKTRLSATIPKSSNILTPGYYHLFLVGSNGVPSKSELLHVGRSPLPPTDLQFATTDAGSVQVKWNDHTQGKGQYQIQVSTDGSEFHALGDPIAGSNTEFALGSIKYVRVQVTQYAGTSTSGTIRLVPSAAHLTLANSECAVNNFANFNARMLDDDGNPIPDQSVNFYLDGEFCGKGVTSEDGTVTVSERIRVDGPPRPILAEFYSAGVYGSAQASATFHIAIPQLVTRLWLGTRVGYAGAEVSVPATLTTKIGNVGVANRTLHFLLDGVAIGDGVTKDQGATSITFTPPDSGTSLRSLTVNFDGDEGATANVTTTNFAIKPRPTSVWVTSAKVLAGKSVSVSSSIIDLISKLHLEGKRLNYSVDGVPVGSAVTNANGAASLSVADPGTGPGTHVIAVSFAGDARSANSSKAGTLAVCPEVVLSVSDQEAKVGDPFTLSAIVTDAVTGTRVSDVPVNISLRGALVGSGRSDANGRIEATPSVQNLEPGRYSFTAAVPATASFGAAPVTRNLRIQALDASLWISAASGRSGESIPVSARLADAESGERLVGKTVTFKIRDVVLGTGTTDAGGQIQTDITVPNLPAGKYTILAVFDGDGRYGAISAMSELRVAALTCSLQVGDSSGTVGGTAMVSATLRDGDTTAGLAGKTIVFKIRDSVVGTGVTTADGTVSAQITVPSLPAGKYGLIATFAGDGTYSAVTSTNFIRISAP